MSNSDQPSRFIRITVDSFASLPGRAVPLSWSFDAKENVMPHLTLVMMIVGALIFVIGIFMDVRAHLEHRGEELAPFRNYFGAEYDRDLLRQSSWSDGENLSGRRTPFDAFDAGDSDGMERYSRDSGTIRRNRDRD